MWEVDEVNTSIFTILLLISIGIVMGVVAYYGIIGETYYIEGNFVRGSHKDPYLCGGHDWTEIVLENYTVTGDIKGEKGRFIFDNIFEKIDNLQAGHRYRFYYSKCRDLLHGEVYYFLRDVQDVGR